MKRLFIYDPENPRRDTVLPLLLDFVRQVGRKVQIEVADPKRTLEQNSLMWAMLADIAAQVDWPVDGKLARLSQEEWKDVLSAGLKREQRVAQGIAGGFVILGQRTSQMTKGELSDLIDLMAAFGAEHDVEWTDDDAKALEYARQECADNGEPTTDTRKGK